MSKSEVTEGEFEVVIKKVLWEYRDCNLRSSAVRNRIASEIKNNSRKAVCKEQEERTRELLATNK
tara:strand:+ start:442 stop:636 length:195 start_codon:yes stop_codon:yes gene_type:complete